jgi:spermidine dehydrogenase
MDGHDDTLGIGTNIARRDFVNGVLVGVGAALLHVPAPARAQGLTDTFTGYGGVGDYARSNGNTAAVVNAAHGLRDGRYEGRIANAPLVDELYDVVIVGGGISGLTAAYTIRKEHPNARVLIIENHPVPGGEAKQNELDVDGVRLIGPQASNDTGVPSDDDPLVGALWNDLGIPRHFDFVEPTGAARGLRFARDNFEPWYWDEGCANVGWFFDGTAPFEVDGCYRDIFADALSGVPFSDGTKRDLLAWHNNEKQFAPPPGQELGPWLDSMSYGAFIRNVMGLGPAAVRVADSLTGTTSYAASADAVSAFGAKLLGLPGVGPRPKSSATSSAFSFPGGNGAIARHLVKALIPDSILGAHTFADVADAPFNFEAFDRPGANIRIRLATTAVAIAHDGDPARAERVRVTYAHGGNVERVEARAVVVTIGGWVAKHVVRDLPSEYRAAYDTFHHAPSLVANVALRNWRPLAKLGITGARWFNGYGFWGNIRQPMTYGSYRPPLDPDQPALFTMYTGFPQPGETLAAQTTAGRVRLLSTTYVDFERQIRMQLQTLFGRAGFDASRDIGGIVLNRWGHAYISPAPGWYFGPNGTPGPREVPRKPFGRIAFGHSELQGRQNWTGAVAEGSRAATQVAAML